jgi:putative CocE/NonD family hydrolase
MIGGSYSAFLQLLAAAEHPEGLAAIVPRASWSDPYRDGWYQNGLFNESVVTAFSGFQPVGGSTGASADARSISALAAHTQNPTPLQLALEHPFDDEFYAERAIYPRYDDITVPALFIDGWFDMFRAGAVRNFNGVASRDKRLIIGPWTHHRAGGLGEIFPEPYPDVLLPEGDPVLAWLDHYVKGIDNGVERAPRVVSYDLGTDDWTLGDAFPPRGASAAALDLSGAPSGSIVSLHDGSLVAHSPRSTGTDGDSYLYDPTSGPTQATGADNATFVGPFADLDQRPDEERTVTYTTAPLGSSLDLRGWMELDLWSTTSAADTDWVVKVSDVQPDGTSRLVSRGFVRASHRAVDPARSRSMQPWLRNDRAEPVAAGSPTEYRIPIEPAGRTLAPGHRLRLSISSSDIAVHQPLPVPAWNTILHDREHPSVLRLQVAADGPKATVME